MAKAKSGNLIPVHREVLADLETPVSAFRKIAGSENAFLLESVEHGQRFGRFSILGCDPHLMVRTVGETTELVRDDGTVVETFTEWRDVDGVQVAWRRKVRAGGKELPSLAVEWSSAEFVDPPEELAGR